MRTFSIPYFLVFFTSMSLIACGGNKKSPEPPSEPISNVRDLVPGVERTATTAEMIGLELTDSAVYTLVFFRPEDPESASKNEGVNQFFLESNSNGFSAKGCFDPQEPVTEFVDLVAIDLEENECASEAQLNFYRLGEKGFEVEATCDGDVIAQEIYVAETGQSTIQAGSFQLASDFLTDINTADSACGGIFQFSIIDSAFFEFSAGVSNNETQLDLFFSFSGAQVMPGTYDIGSPEGPSVSFSSSELGEDEFVSIGSGTVSIIEASPGSVSGTYDLQTGSGGSLSGSFDISY